MIWKISARQPGRNKRLGVSSGKKRRAHWFVIALAGRQSCRLITCPLKQSLDDLRQWGLGEPCTTLEQITDTKGLAAGDQMHWKPATLPARVSHRVQGGLAWVGPACGRVR